VRAAGAAAEAARENRMYQFVDLFYRNQGPENSDYADADFMREIAGQVEGLDVERVVAAATTRSATGRCAPASSSPGGSAPPARPTSTCAATAG
jgi:hypothetical protein